MKRPAKKPGHNNRLARIPLSIGVSALARITPVTKVVSAITTLVRNDLITEIEFTS